MKLTYENIDNNKHVNKRENEPANITILHVGKKGNVERYTDPSETIQGFDIVDLPSDTSIPKLLEAGGDADVIIVDAITPVPAKLIEAMPNLKLIQSEGVAYNAIDIQAAARKGVFVCNGNGMNASAVAEQTILLMLGVLKDVINNDNAVRSGKQIETKEGYMARGDLMELADCTVGLLGFGAIAKEVARILKVFGVKTYYYSRHKAEAWDEAEYGVSYLPLEEMLSTCNMISVHVPVTPETREMVNDDFFAKMQDGAYLINTARGEIVDEHALIRALESGKLAMAGLDTLSGEPVRKDHILLNQKPEIATRILLSPHIGGITVSSFKRGYKTAWRNVKKITAGERPDHVVNGL